MQVDQRTFFSFSMRGITDFLVKEQRPPYIPSQKRGHLLILGQLGGVVQEYVRASKKATTPVSTDVILAAAKGIVIA